MNRRGYTGLLILILLALFLTSCSGAAQTPAPASPTTAGSGGGASGAQVVVTPDDQGKTVNVNVGQQLLVKLGTDGNCKVDVTPSFLLNTVDNAQLNPGEQGLYEAKMFGSATIQATCDNQKQYNISVKINAAQ